jgi:outer membrane protein OmpA-like peptidoglycan-associated protein
MAEALAPARQPDHEGLGYPVRVVILFAAALALALVWLVLPAGRGLAWALTAGIGGGALMLLWLRTRQLAVAREKSTHVLAALGGATAAIPLKLRTRMPLVLVTGDGLPALFNRAGETRYAHVGDGAIWLRVDEPHDLPRVAMAVRQWRDSRAPDGIVLALAPALHASADLLTQQLRVVRQATADAARLFGERLPGYVAIYQRLTPAPLTLAAPQWYGVSSATRIQDTARFEPVIRAAENEAQRTAGDLTTAAHATARAAALASIMGWTQRVVIGELTDRRHPAPPWALHGASWIDCGPAGGPGKPWERDVQRQTRVVPAATAASPLPWPLPQPLIAAMPGRAGISPRLSALAHVIALSACSATFAVLASAKNNEALITRIGADLNRYSAIPADQDTAKRDALRSLSADRDELERHARTGVPLRLSFGMYRGAQLMPSLSDAISSYMPPPSPPAVVALDSMSLFDSGRSQLKAGSTRALVGALEMIKAHSFTGTSGEPGKRILVAGHTDNVGKPDSNLALSIARASAVRDWLIDASGIAATQFATQGYGDTRPIADNDTPAGRASNRRVEIMLVPDTPSVH